MEGLDRNLMLVSVVGIVAIITLTFAFSGDPTGRYADSTIGDVYQHRDMVEGRANVDSQEDLYESINYRKRKMQEYDSSLAAHVNYHDDLVDECISRNTGRRNSDLYCLCRAEDVKGCSVYSDEEWIRTESYEVCISSGRKFTRCQDYLVMA